MKYFEQQWMRPEQTKIGQLDQEEREWLDQAVRAYQRGEVVKILECFHKSQWQYFVEQTKGTEGGGVQMVNRIPDTWARNPNMQIRVENDVIDSRSRQMWWSRRDMPVQYNRQVRDLQHDFVMPYGSYQWHRQQVFEPIAQSGVLRNSRYSRPGHTMEGLDQLTHEQRYDHGANVRNLWRIAQKCHCWVVLDSWCDFSPDDLVSLVTEKVLYPIFYGIPFIYVGGATQRAQLQELDIRPNDDLRTSARSVTEQMLYLQTIFQDPDRAQQWQGQQGMTINHNLERMKTFATQGVGW